LRNLFVVLSVAVKASKLLVKKMISKLNISEIKPSSRRYPAIILIKSVKRDQILNVQGLELLLMERFYLKEWI
jgi:hypothetical protein